MPEVVIAAVTTRGRARLRDLRRDLRRDQSGLALLEFAFTLPLVLAVGGWGIELSNLALTNLRVSQYALNLADHASRVGQDVSGGVSNLREVDVNDVLQGAKLEGSALDLTSRGRITVSSLEKVRRTYADGTSDSAAKQRIHWQRCLGVMSGAGYDSSYPATAPFVSTTAGSDTTQANAGVDAPNGMGDAAAPVSAPNDSGVMFVEVNYQYKPLFGSLYVSPRIIHYIASFIVRDNRLYNQIYNPSPTATAMTCDKHTKDLVK